VINSPVLVVNHIESATRPGLLVIVPIVAKNTLNAVDEKMKPAVAIKLKTVHVNNQFVINPRAG